MVHSLYNFQCEATEAYEWMPTCIWLTIGRTTFWHGWNTYFREEICSIICGVSNMWMNGIDSDKHFVLSQKLPGLLWVASFGFYIDRCITYVCQHMLWSSIIQWMTLWASDHHGHAVHTQTLWYIGLIRDHSLFNGRREVSKDVANLNGGCVGNCFVILCINAISWQQRCEKSWWRMCDKQCELPPFYK